MPQFAPTFRRVGLSFPLWAVNPPCLEKAHTCKKRGKTAVFRLFLWKIKTKTLKFAKIMTLENLKKWLASQRKFATMDIPADLRKSAEEQEDGMIDWILEALRQTSYTFDVEKYEKAVAREDRSLNDILTLVAYSLPGLSQTLRRKKPYLFNEDSAEFFQLPDKEWEGYRKANLSDFSKMGFVKANKK